MAGFFRVGVCPDVAIMQARAAGGMFGVIEATAQLRGGLGARQVEEATCALVHNEGDVLSSNCTLTLGSERR